MNTNSPNFGLSYGSGSSAMSSTHVTSLSECSVCAAMVAPTTQYRHTQFHLTLHGMTPTYSPVQAMGHQGPAGPMGMSGDITPELRELVMDVMKHMRTCDRVADDFMAASDLD